MRDPRVMVMVGREERAAMTSLWALVERLSRLLFDARDPLVAQIKLAWWRDMLGHLANDPTQLPEGEPLLSKLRDSWSQGSDLAALTEPVENMIFAEDDAARIAGASDFGDRTFALCHGASPLEGRPAAGARWGLVWGAMLQSEREAAHTLLARAGRLPKSARTDFHDQKALFTLDRWAQAIALRAGERQWRREALLLLRLGIFGR